MAQPVLTVLLAYWGPKALRAQLAQPELMVLLALPAQPDQWVPKGLQGCKAQLAQPELMVLLALQDPKAPRAQLAQPVLMGLLDLQDPKAPRARKAFKAQLEMESLVPIPM